MVSGKRRSGAPRVGSRSPRGLFPMKSRDSSSRSNFIAPERSFDASHITSDDPVTLPRVLSESLGGAPLALAAQRGERVEWYRRRPQGADEWRDYLRRVAAGHAQRAWLDPLRPALAPSGAAAARLERVT